MEDSPVVAPLQALIDKSSGGLWVGTCQELGEKLKSLAGGKTDKTWPATPRALSGVLRRLAPNFRREGIDVEFHARTRDSRRVTIRALKVEGIQRETTVTTVTDRHTVTSDDLPF
jgi:hypothetical protein